MSSGGEKNESNSLAQHLLPQHNLTQLGRWEENPIWGNHTAVSISQWRLPLASVQPSAATLHLLRCMFGRTTPAQTPAGATRNSQPRRRPPPTTGLSPVWSCQSKGIHLGHLHTDLCDGEKTADRDGTTDGLEDATATATHRPFCLIFNRKWRHSFNQSSSLSLMCVVGHGIEVQIAH